MEIFYIILGIILTLFISINPLLGLFTIVILIPQALIQATSGSFFGIFTAATPIKIIGGITFISTLLHHMFTHKKWDFLKKQPYAISILFFVFIFISGLTKPGVFTRENFTVYTSCAVFGFIILSLVDNIKRFKIVLNIALGSMIAASCYSIFSYISLNQYYYDADRLLRIRGFSYDPNYLGIALLPFAGIALSNMLNYKRIAIKFFYLAILAIITIGIIITFSRGAILGLFGMIIIAAFQAKRKILAILILVSSVVMLINFMPEQVWSRFQETKIEGESSTTEGRGTISSTKRRFLLAKAAIEIFEEYPLTGVGVGNYYWECRKHEPVWAGRAHSMYLEVLSELGIFGFLLFMGILFTAYKTLRRIIRNNLDSGDYARALYVGLTGFLIAAIFFHAQQEKILWFIIFMTAALDRITMKSNETSLT